MLVRLLAMVAVHPVAGWQIGRVLRAYRHAQESLRWAAVPGDVAVAQIRLTYERTNVDRESVVECVSRWMEQGPLPLLSRCVQPGVLEFLHALCKARDLHLGALSDYPAQAKLHALGVAGLEFVEEIRRSKLARRPVSPFLAAPPYRQIVDDFAAFLGTHGGLATLTVDEYCRWVGRPWSRPGFRRTRPCVTCRSRKSIGSSSRRPVVASGARPEDEQC